MTFTDPSYAIQASVVAALKGSADLTSIVGDAVFDAIPKAKYPRVNVNAATVFPELGDGTDAAESTLEIHGWSEKVGFGEIYNIGAAVIAALHDVGLVVGGRRVQSILLDTARYLRDPDGLTSHGIFTFTILTDANS